MDQTEEQEQAQANAHPPSWAALMGENLGPDPFEDAGPSPRSSAAIHASRRRAKDAAQQQERDLAQLQVVAQEDADGRDLAHAIRLADAGRPIPRDVMAGAMRAARARGTSISSAEQLAKMAGR